MSEGPLFAPASASPPLGHQLVRADAGSGKTYALAVRYLALLAAGAAPEKILAATFTRKAAGEILERILLRLARAALDPQAARALSSDLEVPREAPPPAFGAQLARLCRGLHRVQVGTLDAFFHRVTLAFRLELGLPAVASVAAAEDPGLAPLRFAAVGRALDELASEGEDALVELLGRLYRGDAQRSVTAALDRVVLEVYETFRLAPEGAAWRSLENPYRALDGPALVDAVDRLGDQAAGCEGALLDAVTKDYRQAQRADWLGFLGDGPAGKVAEDPNGAAYRRRPLPRGLVRAYQPLVEHARWDLLDRLVRQTEATHHFVEAFDRHFERLRRARGVVLFSDFTRLLAGRLLAGSLTGDLAGFPDEALLGLFYRLDARVEHLLLDEFQDTSREQWLALAWLADEILAWGDGSRTLFCVGDPKQSIYGWRGGCAELFDVVESRLFGAIEPQRSPEDPSAPLRRLGVSYRSSPVVLDAVDAVFSRLERNPALAEGPAREAAVRWVGRYQRHTAASPERPGWVRLVTSGEWEGEFPADMPARTAEEDAETDADDEQAEAQRPVGHLAHVADRIAEIVARAAWPADAGSADAAGTRGAEPGFAEISIGVLTLTNRTAAELLALLRARGVAASGEGGGPLIDDPAVTVVLSALWLAAHPGDSAAAFHVATSPLGAVLGLRPAPVPALERAGSASAVPADAISRATAEVARRVRGEVLERGVPAVLAQWARALLPVTSERSGARLAQLIELAEAHERDGLGGPFELVARARAMAIEEPSPAPVRVMTVHRAKGLEFDVVVLPELERRLGDLNNPLVLVHRPAPTSPIAAVHRGTNKTVRACSEPLREVHWQEVARRVADDLGVLYVALTRARSELHLIVQPTPRSSAGRATFAELLRHALASAARERWGAGGAVLYEEGGVVDLAALRRARGAAGAPPAPRPEEGHLEPRVEQESRPPRRPRVPRLALERPSQLAGAVNEGTRAVRELLRLEPAEERLRGALMHEWLRHVEWLDEGGGLPAADHAWRLAQGIAPGLDRERVARWRDALARALEAPAVAAAFSRPPGKAGSYRLWRERPFALALDGRLVRGVVDRALVWGAREAPSGVELFEIKSDRVASGGVDLVVERHRLQVLAYRQAVATMLGLLPTAVRGSLVLLDAAAVIAVE